MDLSSNNFQLKANALEIIRNYRVPDLQALLKYARLSQQGNKRELFQRCKILISSHASSQLLNKINQIEIQRINTTKSHHSSMPCVPKHAIILSSTPPVDNLPPPNHIQYVHLPFYEKMRTIESINIPVNTNTYPPLRFILTDFDVDLILKGLAKVFLRIAPTILSEKQNDVLPPYLFIQCNGQIVINNNALKTIGSQAHSIVFPTDITDKLIPKSNIHNTLNYVWLQSPISMSFKNLPKSYTLSIQLIRCISLDSLVNYILKQQSQLTNIHNSNDSDIEIEDIGLMTTRQRVSLICPITQSLIVIPVKSSYCSHLTCFDLRTFLQMNQKRLQWTCPICKKSASYETLHVDKRLQSILLNIPNNCSTVEIDTSTKILSDCQYILDNVKHEKTDIAIANASDQNDEESIHNSPNKSRRQSNGSDCIVLSSEGESENEDNDLFNQNSINSFQSIIEPNVDDKTYWEDIARITHDLISNNNEEIRNRKRSNSSNSCLLSDDDDDNHHPRKRIKQSTINQSRTDDIEIITLSSSASSDNDDQLS